VKIAYGIEGESCSYIDIDSSTTQTRIAHVAKLSLIQKENYENKWNIPKQAEDKILHFQLSTSWLRQKTQIY
jgi:hypothetical protein